MNLQEPFIAQETFALEQITELTLLAIHSSLALNGSQRIKVNVEGMILGTSHLQPLSIDLDPGPAMTLQFSAFLQVDFLENEFVLALDFGEVVLDELSQVVQGLVLHDGALLGKE